MIKYVESTVFNVECDAIVNTINCDGFMGAGLAYEFSLRYPSLLSDYIDKCNNKEIKVGNIYYYELDDLIIVNFPTKNHFKFPSQIQWIEQGLIDFKNTYKDYNIKSIAFPYLGCSKGGLEICQVKLLMEKYLSDLDIDIYICENSSKEAFGIEKKMLDEFKITPIYTLKKIARLNLKQEEIIRDNKNKITRFQQILKLPSIGKGTYERLFKYFYNTSDNIQEEIKYEQTRLF